MSWFSTSQRPISRAGPLDQRDVSRRQAGLEQELEQQRRAERRRLRRLDHDGIARRQRRRHLVRHQVQRRVERRDAADDAARHADREGQPMRVPGARLDRHDLAGQPFGFLGGEQERLNRARRLRCRRRRTGSRPRRRCVDASPGGASAIRSARVVQDLVALAGRRALMLERAAAPRPPRHRLDRGDARAATPIWPPVNLSNTRQRLGAVDPAPPIRKRASAPGGCGRQGRHRAGLR